MPAEAGKTVVELGAAASYVKVRLAGASPFPAVSVALTRIV